jgi:hypothetical protein
MRFNNRACALMDIPDLPQSAFEHIGDRKIKPQGGGGGDIVSAITDPISSAIGTDGGGGGILGAVEDVGQSVGSGLAAIDPGPAIGSGLADVDEFVNDEIPGGWATVGAAAVAAATGYVDPSLLAAEAGAGTAGAAGGTAAGTGITGGVGGATGILTGGSVGTGLSAGSAAGIAGTQAAAGLGIAGGSALAGGLGATGAGLSGVGSLSPALPAAGGVGGAGTGLSAQLAPGTILGTGLPGGGAIGSSYMLGTNGLPAVNAAGQLIPASSVSFGGQAAAPVASLSVNDALNAARLSKGLLTESPATPAGATAQFRGSTIPQGGVDYSGILNLLQARSPQRNPYSLLG